MIIKILKYKKTIFFCAVFFCALLICLLLILRQIFITEKNEHNINKIYVSLTTIPSRIHNLEKILDSLLTQTQDIHEILLNIPIYSKRFKKEYSIPDFLKKTKFNKVKIIRCEDYGPGTKLLGALEYLKYKKGYVIIVDDDRIINKNLIKSLYDKQINNTNSIISNEGNNQGLPVLLPVGAGGISIPINMLDKNEILSFFNKHKNVCTYVDDVFWYKYFIKKKKYNIIYHRKIGVDNGKDIYDDSYVGINGESNNSDALYTETGDLSRYNNDKTIGLNQKCFEN